MQQEEDEQRKIHNSYISSELCYIKNPDGTYSTELSAGWDVKRDALDNAWSGINERIEKAKIAVQCGKKSPIFYYMHKNLMDISLLSSYTNYCKLRVWWHMRPSVFKKLNSKILQQYAKVFNILPNEINTLK